MVIVIDGEKYACASCIRGHRVKKCNHNERQLVPMVKRGRQVSQCSHCRDLRKKNGVHVKCTCAIASTPNPINGCLCEVINSCSCVASHLQEVYDGNKHRIHSFTDSNTASSCHKPTNPPFSINPRTTLDQPHSLQALDDSSPLIDDSDLLNFLENELDKYITTGHNPDHCV